MARIKIKKVSTTRLSPITGSIVNGTNFVDKEHNTYSAEIIDGEINTINNQLNNEYYVDIKNQITKTGTVSDVEVVSAYAKKRNGFTSLKILLRTKNGWPTTNVNDVIAVPAEYASSTPVYGFCRMNNNYDYPQWNGGTENIGFLFMSTNYICIRTSHSGMRVVAIDLVY